MPFARNWNPFAMDDTLQELENELKRLPPRWLSVNLIQTLERELGPETPRAPQRRCATEPPQHS